MTGNALGVQRPAQRDHRVLRRISILRQHDLDTLLQRFTEQEGLIVQSARGAARSHSRATAVLLPELFHFIASDTYRRRRGCLTEGANCSSCTAQSRPEASVAPRDCFGFSRFRNLVQSTQC